MAETDPTDSDSFHSCESDQDDEEVDTETSEGGLTFELFVCSERFIECDILSVYKIMNSLSITAKICRVEACILGAYLKNSIKKEYFRDI
jgi:hypothetical protein